MTAARKRYSFFIDDEQAAGLKAVKAKKFISESDQIRLAINDWLDKELATTGESKAKGKKKKSAPRAATRKRR